MRTLFLLIAFLIPIVSNAQDDEATATTSSKQTTFERFTSTIGAIENLRIIICQT